MIIAYFKHTFIYHVVGYTYKNLTLQPTNGRKLAYGFNALKLQMPANYVAL